MAKETECHDDFKTLFKKCEELNTKILEADGRIAVTENNIHHIQNSAKSIEDNVSRFMDTVNGIPMQNQKAIEEMKEDDIKPMKNDIRSNRTKIIKWGAVISALVTLLSFVISILF